MATHSSILFFFKFIKVLLFFFLFLFFPDQSAQLGKARAWAPAGWGPRLGSPATPVFLPGESHGHRSLVDYSP